MYLEGKAVQQQVCKQHLRPRSRNPCDHYRNFVLICEDLFSAKLRQTFVWHPFPLTCLVRSSNVTSLRKIFTLE